MQNPNADAVNLDTQCFIAAMYVWNVKHAGSSLPEVHLPWWKLSPDDKSEVMRIAQELKVSALSTQEVYAECPS